MIIQLAHLAGATWCVRKLRHRQSAGPTQPAGDVDLRRAWIDEISSTEDTEHRRATEQTLDRRR